MHRLLAILVALVLTLSSLSQAGASTMRTLTCASARYRMTFPASWKVTHGCRAQMDLAAPEGTISMSVVNNSLPDWAPTIGRLLVKLFLGTTVPATTKLTITKAAVIDTRTIAGKVFVQGEEEATDGVTVYVIGLLEGAQRGRMYNFDLVLKMTDSNAADQANTKTGLAVWNSIRLL